MDAIEMMNENRGKHYAAASKKEEELLKLKSDADGCLEDKEFVWFEIYLNKMLECTREIKKHRDMAMMWETAVIELRHGRR